LPAVVAVADHTITGIVVLITVVEEEQPRVKMDSVVVRIRPLIADKVERKPLVVLVPLDILQVLWQMEAQVLIMAAAAAAAIMEEVVDTTAAVAAVALIMRYRKQLMSCILKGFRQETAK
jgi:hypothetical protein